jgi:ABC-type multidrug transport system permease subunit
MKNARYNDQERELYVFQSINIVKYHEIAEIIEYYLYYFVSNFIFISSYMYYIL